jgi:hypothetical protein
MKLVSLLVNVQLIGTITVQLCGMCGTTLKKNFNRTFNACLCIYQKKKDRKQYVMSVTIDSIQSAVIKQVKKPTWQAKWRITQTQRVGSQPLPLCKELRRGRSVQRGGGLSDNELSTTTDGCICSLLYFPNRKKTKSRCLSYVPHFNFQVNIYSRNFV